MTTNDHLGIDLADAIEAIRDQLVDAASRGADSAIAFEVGPIELEFTVELRTDARAKGGVRAWVVSADAEAGVSRGRVQRVAVTLSPKQRASGERIEVENPRPANLDGF
ncbi:hypothetical protein ABIA32_004862 [Streptacidiphilus sp. MAP12-20]|uniref:trypco2 family protein n=1 Tax=Streptacidiphilus sp. MAP12-20 TaxID=3156299 RepID=UPI0035133934